MVLMSGKEEWKSVSTMLGVQCVTRNFLIKMLLWYVANLDLKEKVTVYNNLGFHEGVGEQRLFLPYPHPLCIQGCICLGYLS